MAKLASIVIHADSLGWSLAKDPQQFRDPTHFEVADRFFALATKHRFTYTIFVLGRDLENPEVRSRVREWHDAGHEIGNHSYSHKINLGSLPHDEIESEVLRTHELITRACGTEPRGFIAPSWATSSTLIEILARNRYLYDTSLFPSYFMWLISAKLLWNYRHDRRRHAVLQRRDWLANLVGSRKPFFADGRTLTRKRADGLLIIPQPVTPFLRIPCWHTMAFILPEFLYRRTLSSAAAMRYFYYVLHSPDLIDVSDVPEADRERAQAIERIGVPLAEKTEILDRCLETVKNKSERLVTMGELAEAIRREHRCPTS